MIERIILSIIAILILTFTIKKGDRKSIWLTSGLTIGILITWTGVSLLITAGLVIYMLTALSISLINFKATDLSRYYQVTIILSGLWAFTANLFSLMYWPYAGEIRLSMIIPIMLYIISLTIGMIQRNEVGYLTIINAAFVLRLIR